jgi:hypothetical protein
MTMRYLWMGLLVAGGMLLSGCGGDDDSDAAAQPAAQVQDPDAAFANITPSGLGVDKFTIAGHGTTFACSCSEVSGAVSYTFASSTAGGGDTVSEPAFGFLMSGAIPSSFTFTVYATDGNGINTRVASKTANF